MKTLSQFTFGLFFFLTAMASAETQAPGAVPVVPTAPAKPGFSNSMEVLSKDFFEKKADEGPKSGRSDAGEPDYNTADREKWLKACEKLKNKDLEAYRKCFQDEKAKSKEALRQSFEEVERRQALPLRNTNPLLEEQRNVNGWDEE